MAFRIHENVVRGEIDNTHRGIVTGRIWLAGCEKPLILEKGLSSAFRRQLQRAFSERAGYPLAETAADCGKTLKPLITQIYAKKN